MNAFFGNALLKSKDAAVKEALAAQVVASVRDVQLELGGAGWQQQGEAAEALCTVLEAVCLHGARETLLDRLALAVADPDVRPEPSFWPPLLVFSHRDLINQIGRLNFISTDIGRCRAWLRMALNESLLASYLQSMSVQNRALGSFYKRSAFLRDAELLDMLVTQVASVEGAYSFSLVVNSSLLNTWGNEQLLLAGLWSPALKSCPITSGTDIASALTSLSRAEQAEDSVSSVLSVASLAFDEDEALKIILGSDVTQDEPVSAQVGEGTEVAVLADSSQIGQVPHENSEESHGMEASRTEARLAPLEAPGPAPKEGATAMAGEEVREKPQLQSYHSLVQSYNQTSSEQAPAVADLDVLLQKFHCSTETPLASSTDSDSSVEKLDFEVVHEMWDPSDIPDFSVLLHHINRIPTEKGLDSQNYTCHNCSEYVGISFRPARVCGLTGAYYCTDCFGPDQQWVIPARIMHNWDFRRYPVSQKAADFLYQVQPYPLFDLSIVNPKIYAAIVDMARLKEMRVRLNFLRPYLLTCRENVMETLQRQIWPRDYLYEKIHHYSLSDLMQVPSGPLQSALQRAIDSASAHVLNCIHCTLKGFICEICEDQKPIFPFDLDTTFRCESCSGVYHASCLQSSANCRKCLRIQQRNCS